jgi:DNA-binding CsgD family transcriptional regulator/tetratricopeptide (TPR) repeat protein
MKLIEREAALAALDERFAEARRGDGSVVLVHGEAGIGKTSLLRTWTSTVRSSARLGWGVCDPLTTPSPLAPLREVAAELGGQVLQALRSGAATLEVFAAFMAELRQRPHVVVFEDLHWADEATLDLLRYAGRRIGSTPSVLIISVRDDEPTDTAPLQAVIGELTRAAAITRVRLRPLSRSGVAELVAGHRDDADVVHRRTGGNPFFVTEVARHSDADVPDSVRDATLARLVPLDDRERSALELLACVPGRVEDKVVSRLLGDRDVIDRLVARGLLTYEGHDIAFRHELVRLAVVDRLPVQRRRSSHRAILAALEERNGVDAAVLTHHAVEAGANDKVLAYARRAAVEAAAAGAHREAARFLLTALERADQLAATDRAEVLESQSYELYLTDRIDEAITAREQAVRLREKEGDRVAVGAGHRWISRLSWFTGRREKAERHAARAVELLEGAGDLRELGFAYSNRAQLAMIAGNESAAVSWGERALEVADKLGDAEIRAHALINVGTAREVVGDPQGRQMLLESIALAREHGLDEHVARGYTNVAWNDVESRRFTHGEQMLREGIAFTTQRDLDAWRRYMLGCRARLHLLRGRLTAAADDATAVLAETASPVSRIWPLMVLGLVRTRRGDPGAGEALDEAWAIASQVEEVQRLATLAAARAEHAWITGITPDLDQLRDVHGQAVGLRDAWLVGEVASWLHRLGGAVEGASELLLPEPYALELAGEHMAAAAAWRELGCPYEAALAMADSGAGPGMLPALELLTELGAEGSARRIRQRLRELGVSGVPRGPRASTRANPALLTARQVEVVALLAAGLTNAEIAEELVISPKTAGHHVSAILDKLGARSRTEAANMARELGLTS